MDLKKYQEWVEQFLLVMVKDENDPFGYKPDPVEKELRYTS